MLSFETLQMKPHTKTNVLRGDSEMPTRSSYTKTKAKVDGYLE